MEPPPQRTKRARRKSSGGAAGDSGRGQQYTGEGCHSRLKQDVAADAAGCNDFY